MSLQLGLKFNVTKSKPSGRRQLLQSSGSLVNSTSNLAVDVRIAEPGPSAITGVGGKVDTQWENNIVAKVLAHSGVCIFFASGLLRLNAWHNLPRAL